MSTTTFGILDAPLTAEVQKTRQSALYEDTSVGKQVTGPISAGTNKPSAPKAVIVKTPKHGEAVIVTTSPGQWVYRPAGNFVGYDEFAITTSGGPMTRVVVMVCPEPTFKTYYVDGVHGDDRSAGSLEKPFATIQAAEQVSRPGDTVLIRDGIYTETSNQTVLQVSHSGLREPRSRTRLYGEHPVLHTAVAWNTILIFAAYIRIEGLEIAGNAKNVSIAKAANVADRFIKGPKVQTFGPETSAYETNGVFVRPVNSKSPMNEMLVPRHVQVTGNYVHDCQGGGISATQSDYVTVTGNRIERNAVRAMYATSGISLLGLQNTDFQRPAYKDFISDNVLTGNETKIVWAATKKMSDENGIILDSNRNSEDSTGEPYTGRILVANNIVSESGGAGTQIYATDNADVVFNTVYHNSRTPALHYGQIWCHRSANIRIMNNIVVADEGQKINEQFDDTQNVLHDYNVYFRGKYLDLVGTHDIIADPRFVDMEAKDFRLTLASPAIDSALAGFGLKTDNVGHPRPSGKGPERGALELQQSSCYPFIMLGWD